jgi:general L-amino acid transport system permease protein
VNLTTGTSPARAPLWRDARVRGWVIQAVALCALGLLTWVMMDNASRALAERGLSSGFGFLDEPEGFTLSETILPFGPSDSFGRAFLAGLANTLKVSVAAIILATGLGALIGLARLSANPLLSALAGGYVELFRNTPQLLQIIFWYVALIALPTVQQAIALPLGAALSNRGLVLPWLEGDGGFVAVGLACGLIAATTVLCVPRRWRGRGRAMAFAFALPPLVAWGLAGAPTAISVPALRGFNYAGGVTLSPEFLALFMGLSLYIASFIAEIVRAGLLSVDRGQMEAARALVLSPREVLGSVAVPQALRVIVPPMAAQHISLVKNSSLGVAIGYPELFNISNSAATLSGRAVECVAIMAGIYVLVALGLSALANAFNRATLIEER